MKTNKLQAQQQAERVVLGSMLLDPRCIQGVMEKLSQDDFSTKKNREIFQSICALHRGNHLVDPLAVLRDLRKTNHWDDLEGRNYLCRLIFETPSAAQAEESAEQMRLLSSEGSGRQKDGKASGKPPP